MFDFRNRRRCRPAVLHLVRSAVVLAILSVASVAEAADSAPVESLDALKAAFVFNFAKFASWPQAKKQNAAMTFCIEDGSLSSAAFQGWERKTVHDAQVRVLYVTLDTPEQLKTCNVLFVGATTAPRKLQQLASVAAENSILMVSDAEGFAENGGQIELFLLDRKLRFRVNVKSVQAARIMLSSQILSLAEIVDAGRN